MLQPDEKCNEILQKPEKPRKMTANQIAYHALRHAGLNASQATREIGVTRAMGTCYDKKSKQNHMDAIEKLAPASVKAIKKLSQGQLVGEMTDIKGSDVLGANKMIWDRVAPTVQAAPTTAGNTFTQIIINNLPGQSDKLPVIDIG